MIGNTLEYLQANNQIFQIMQMIEGNPIFDELKPCLPSDIVNLSLDILRILIQIHNESGEDVECNQRLIMGLAESSNSFAEFSNISMYCQRQNNDELCKVLGAFDKIEDKDDFISRILTYGENLEYKGD